jgi:methionyl aminopeptidase
MMTLKSPREIELMARAGEIVAGTLELVGGMIRPGVTTEALDTAAERFIRSHPGATPSFKGLYGFPKSLCISINDEIVHGIPSPRRVLHEGNIVSIDVGVFLNGYHADSAATFPVGEISPEARRLLDVTRAALNAGIAQAQIGNHIGDIGHAIQRTAEAAGFGVVRELVGHGVGQRMHEDPQVPNHGQPHRGPRLQAGMTLALEPMITAGDYATRMLDDKWTVVTADGSLSAHFEHTVAITREGPRVLTNGGQLSVVSDQ